MYAVLGMDVMRYDCKHTEKKAAKNCDHCEMYTHDNEAEKKSVCECVRVGRKATRIKW